MANHLGRAKILFEKTIYTIQSSGFKVFLKKAIQYIIKNQAIQRDHGLAQKTYMDVLFINGCFLPHPHRYRVSHQREQLLANGIKSNEVFYEDVSLDLVKNYRVFIFFRCPITDTIEELIHLAKNQNKTVLFDIDDLVIDTYYTDQIPYLKTMTKQEKEAYDAGVNRMKKTLCLCDAAITTTERLAIELEKYVPEVYINRNTASDKMVALSQTALKEKVMGSVQSPNSIRIGYFSGSITHNDDFAMILPVIERLMREHQNLELHIVGELDIPREMEPYKSRIVASPFVDWTKLPQLIASVDINIAPVALSIFNEAKSENKWVEAALVKTPTVASAVGAMERMIENNKTGLLCTTPDEWYNALNYLIADAAARCMIAENAYQYVMGNCLTIYSGYPLAKYIRSKMKPNIAFVLPSTQISGGVLVALKHCAILKKAGLDVIIINESFEQDNVVFDGEEIFVVSRHETAIEASFDKCVATLWTTLDFINSYPDIRKRYYLVQNFETDFYEHGERRRIFANATYNSFTDVKYITISKWCQNWLKEKYEKNAAYAPNGLDTDKFKPVPRVFSGKIRVLVEGNSDDYYKNVDESFAIIDKLDKSKFEIWYMSYQGKPKGKYHVDRFLHRVPYEKVPEVYKECHILIKTSILESFSYPPLEMMATGGMVVACPNGGNLEYLSNEKNCLLYPQGNLEAAVQAIERICQDEELRKTLYEGGVRTAAARDWNKVKQAVLALYDITSGNINIKETGDNNE